MDLDGQTSIWHRSDRSLPDLGEIEVWHRPPWLRQYRGLVPPSSFSQERCCRQRPYFVEHTRSHPNSEVKRRKARSVLGWGTAREALRVLLAFCRKLLFPFESFEVGTPAVTVAILAQRSAPGRCARAASHFWRFRTSDAVFEFRLVVDSGEWISPTAILRRIHPIPSELGS